MDALWSRAYPSPATPPLRRLCSFFLLLPTYLSPPPPPPPLLPSPSSSPPFPPSSPLPPSLPPLALGCVFMRVHKRGWSTCSRETKNVSWKKKALLEEESCEEMRRVPVRETARWKEGDSERRRQGGREGGREGGGEKRGGRKNGKGKKRIEWRAKRNVGAGTDENARNGPATRATRGSV